MRKVEKFASVFLFLAFAGAVYVGFPLLEAMAFGVALAYVVRPLAYKLRKRVGPTFSSFISLGIALLLLFSFFFYSTGTIIIEADNFMKNEHYKLFTEPANEFLERNPAAKEYFEQGTQFAVNFVSKELENPTRIIDNMMGFFNFFVTILMALIIAFYLLKDGDKLKTVLLDLFPGEYGSFVEDAFVRIDKDLEMMFVGSLFTALFVWAVTSIFFIYLGIPYAMLLGLLCGLLQLLPMVGPQIILALVAIALIFFGNLWGAIIVVILAVALFLFSDTLVRSIISRKTGTIHSLVVLISFIGGTLALGLKGVVLGPIIFAILDGVIVAYNRLKQ